METNMPSNRYEEFDRSSEGGKRKIGQGQKKHIRNLKYSYSLTESSENMYPGISQMWKDFKDRSSLHGLKHAGDCGKYKIRGWIWLTAVLCMMGCLIYTVSNLYVQYHRYKTNTNLNAELSDSLPFPAVTVCNLSPFNNSDIYSDEVLKHHFISNSIIGKHDLSIPKLNGSLLNKSVILNVNGNRRWSSSLFRNFGSTLIFCQFEGRDICLENILPRLTNFGLCFTFNPWNGTGTTKPLNTRKTGSKDALNMYLRVGQKEYTHGENVAAGFKIVVHDPRDEPDLESDGFLVSPGFSTSAALEMRKKIYQPRPFKAFGDKYCIDTEGSSFINTLQYHRYYSYNGCIRECREAYTYKQCGCRDYTDLGNGRMCSFREISECVHKYADKFKGDDDLMNSCDCHVPCTSVTYRVQTSFAYFPSDINSRLLERIGYQNLRKDYLEVRIFYDSLTLLKITQIPEYTIDGIIGTLGGQMGLFLGASLLTISEFLEFGLLMIMEIFRRIMGRKQKIEGEDSSKDSSGIQAIS